MASTATAIFILRNSAAIAANVISFTFEIIRMAGCAEGSVLRPGPGNVTANGITVAAVTTRVVPMVARIVSLRVVVEAGRCPAVGGMTHVALFGRG